MAKFYRHNTKSAKVTPSMVLDIRSKYGEGASQGELSREYGLSVVQIGRIVRGESWQSLPTTPLTPAELQLSAMRAMEVQKEFNATDKLAGDIAAEREKATRGDTLVEELKVKGPPTSDAVKAHARELLGYDPNERKEETK